MLPARRTWLFGAVLVLLTLVAYSSVLATGGFVWDDDDHLTNVKAVRTLSGLKTIWLEPGKFIQFYPMVFTSFNLEYQLWGGKAGGYHFTNVLLHGVNAFLVWLVLRRLNVPGAMPAALIFAVHPVMVESVAWITERKNVLSAFFYLTAMLAYFKFEPAFATGTFEAKRKWGFYPLALVLFGMGLLSKSVVVSFPIALAIVLWYRTGRVRLRDVGPLVPMVVLAVMAGLHTATWERYNNGASGPEWDFSLADRILIAGRAVLFYPRKLILPTGLTFIYPRWDIQSGVWWQYLFPLGAAALFSVPFLMLKRWGRGPAAAVLFFVVTLGPALGFANIWTMRFSFVADHYQYMASLGLIALASAALTIWTARLPAMARMGAMAVVVVALGVATFFQGFIYRDLETLWTDTLKKNPQSFLAHQNLALIYFQNRRVDEAIAHLEMARNIKPKDNADVLAKLGTAYFNAGRVEEGEAVLLEGYAQEGNVGERALIANTLGAIHIGRNDPAGALKYFEESVALVDKYSEPFGNLARLELALGQYDKARQHANKALDLNPQNKTAWEVLRQLDAKK